ncbi:NAD(P)-dependent oxidoreductase [Parapedobacter tibetensis]|uniref:NAD(P)-dependent oxidoreductase n=1 Tax=Parapedobacter tibetensis TaxID=2972951 RepID=UPI00214D4CD0|nr:SDR family oxidoreductase [Parapedobacter tibetensis]
MKKIIVFGVTGGTGRLVVKQALEAGHQVTGVVRNPDAFTLKHQQLTIIQGDVLQPNSFENAIREQDVVISCLGTQQREPTTIYSEGVGNIIKAMQKEDINRMICISAGAVTVPPKSSFIMKFVVKNILQRIFKYAYADMLKMEKLLTETNLNWTVIRSPWLRNTRLTGKYRTTINEPLRNPSKISRADLADYIVNHLTDEKTFKAKIEISY